MEELKRSGNRRINCRGRNPLIFLLKVHRCGNRASRMEGQCSAHLSDFIAVEAGGEVCCSGPKNMNLVGGQTLTPLKESYDQPRQHVKKQRHYFANKGPSSQSYDFSSGHVWMSKLEKEAESEVAQSCPTLCNPHGL